MKGGKKRFTNTDTPVHLLHAPPSSSAAEAEEEENERRRNSDVSARFEAAAAAENEGEDEEEGEDEDSDKDYEQLEDTRTGETAEAEAERMKLAEGYFEIEAVRRKRVRKGKVQYLIKWRDWSEAANTWEPVENLAECSDIIDAFEESLKAGKSRSTRKRKRKTSITPVQTKKKQPHPLHQQRSHPGTSTYNVPSHAVRTVDSPISFSRLNNLPCTNDSEETHVNGVNSAETTDKVNENGTRTISFMSEEEKEQSELDFKRSEKRAKVSNMEGANMPAVTSPENQMANGLRKTDGVDPVQSGRCTGAKKRKSGSVKRFQKDIASCSADDAAKESASVVPTDVKQPEFLANNCKNKYEDSKSMCTITQIVKPISYKASTSDNVQDVFLAFEALRSDGTKVTVDNKFLKANNPLLLIDFYEKHLRYSPT